MRSWRLGLILCVFGLTGCPNVGELLRSYGYTEVRPPSALLMPGTMVWVEHHRPFTAGVICTQKASLGEDFKPMISATADSNFLKSSGKTFEFDATYLDVIKADAQFSDIDSITIQMDKATILEVNDTDILSNIKNRDPACAQAIAMRSKDYKISMISSALQADVIYAVKWNIKSSLDVSAKIAVLQNLALELGLSGDHVSEQSIEAKNLIWGIKDDTYLARLDGSSTTQTVPLSTRAIAPESIPLIITKPDVE